MADPSTQNAEALCKNSENQIDRINCLIKQFTELVEAVNKSRHDLHYWKSQSSTLLISIWSTQVKYTELEKKEGQIRQIISGTTKMIEFIQQELKNLRTKRIEYSSTQCDIFRNKQSDLTNNIVRAHAEYSTENLSRDIEHYRQEYNKEKHIFSALKKKLENLEMWHISNCLNSEETEEISKINTLLSDIKVVINNESQSITLAQSRLEKLKAEIKEKKQRIGDFKK